MFDLAYPQGSARTLPLLRSDEMPRSGEMLPIVEPSGLVIGQADRAYCHGGSKLLHPVVHLHIINRMGQIYLQKRSMTKDLLPGYWDTAVGGHIGYGEYIREALFREASEELGFFDFNPVYIESYVFESKVEKELVNIFAAIGNFDLHPDSPEVDEGRWWSEDDIEAAMGKNILTPNFEGEYKRIHDKLEALL